MQQSPKIIIIPGNPISKKRHRCRCIHGHGQAYDEQASSEMPIISAIMKLEMSKNLFSFSLLQNITVNFRFYLPIPKSDPVGLRNAKLWGFLLPNEKPDFDNLIKFYCDCANGVLWEDDKRIVQGTFHKFYDENPRVEIEIMEKKYLPTNEKDLLAVFSPHEFEEFVSYTKQLGETNVAQVKEDSEGLVLSKTALLLGDFVTRFSKAMRKIEKINKDTCQDSTDS